MSNRPFDPMDLKIVLTHPIDAVDYIGMKPNENPTYADRQRFEQVRTRLDRAIQASKTIVEVPQQGESPQQYERRLVSKLMKSCTTYDPMNLKKIPEDLFRDIEKTVVREALQAPVRRGELVPIKVRDAVGRQTTEYEGNMGVWLNQFKGPIQTGPILVDGKPRPIPLVLS